VPRDDGYVELEARRSPLHLRIVMGPESEFFTDDLETFKRGNVVESPAVLRDFIERLQRAVVPEPPSADVNCEVTIETSETEPTPCGTKAKYLVANNTTIDSVTKAMCKEHAIRAVKNFGCGVVGVLK
jgi:hypothetical protein